jgi:hypothetical protein
MDNNPNILDSLMEKIENYSKINIELMKLISIKKVAKFTSILYVNSILALVLILCVFLVTIGLAIWVGNIFGEMSLGFFIVAAAYAILGLIYCVFLFRYNKKTIEKRLINFLVD